MTTMTDKVTVTNLDSTEILLPTTPKGSFWEIQQGWMKEYESEELVILTLRKPRVGFFTKRPKRSRLIDSRILGHISGLKYEYFKSNAYEKAEDLLADLRS